MNLLEFSTSSEGDAAPNNSGDLLSPATASASSSMIYGAVTVRDRGDGDLDTGFK